MIRGGREGYERLLVLARERWPDTAALFERVGLSPGMRCIDLGCGGGEVTLEMARLVGPGGSVTGIDMDEVKLDLARQAAARSGLGNVEFRLLNLHDWDEPTAYDTAYCRFVLQHLSLARRHAPPHVGRCPPGGRSRRRGRRLRRVVLRPAE